MGDEVKCEICGRDLDPLDDKCGSDEVECLLIGYEREKARAEEAEAREARLAAANSALADAVTRCAGIESDLAATQRQCEAMRAALERIRAYYSAGTVAHFNAYAALAAPAAGEQGKW